MRVLGFDPGGIRGFGCVHYDTVSGNRAGFTATSVDEAVRWAAMVADVEPVAAGIDTLLYWQSTKSGWRGADQYLRARYPRCRNSVVSSNGLYGSMAVQGAVLAHRLRECWSNIRLTETHPKVLWHHLFERTPYPRDWREGVPVAASNWMASEHLDQILVADDHQFDALMSAWAAGKGFGGHWSRDLVAMDAVGQIGRNVSVVPNINYYWPE